MLTRDRPKLAKGAVECFRAQTYPAKELLIWDTSDEVDSYQSRIDRVAQVFADKAPRTIGALRNEANAYNAVWHSSEILIHWDDDDWSHPDRIAGQVALLEESGADVVGYNEMLFWRADRGQAWLYSNTHPKGYALGTSLCYWRKTWERHHFANDTQGVEERWLREKKVVSETAMYLDGEPLMIARIHSGNTSSGYRIDEYASQGSREWKRVPEWDERVRWILG
jgi:hypothetical protein